MSLNAFDTTLMQPAGVTIDMIDRQLQDGFSLLKFQSEIENLFESETAAERTAALIRFGMLGLVIFDLYLVIDWRVLPDVFASSVIYRLALFTPLAGLGVLVTRRCRSIPIREGISAGFAFLAVSIPLVLFMQSASPLRGNYHYNIALTMTFAAVVQRARFRYIVAQTLGSLLAVSFALLVTDTLEDALRPVCISFHVTAAILLLWAAYTLERALRRNYLLDLRTRLIKTSSRSAPSSTR